MSLFSAQILQYLYILLALFIFLVLPGYLFYCLIFKKNSLVESFSATIMSSFVLSLFIYAICTILVMFFKISITIFVYILIFLIISGAFYCISKHYLRVDVKKWLLKLKKLSFLDYIVLLSILIVAVLIYVKGADISGDPVDHIATIRKIAFSDKIALGAMGSTEWFSPIIYLIPTYHFALGIISKIIQVDPIILWSVLSFFLFPIACSAIFSMSTRFFKNPTIGKFSLLAFVSIYGFNILNAGKGFSLFSYLPYPSVLCMLILMPFIFYFSSLHVEHNRRVYLYLFSAGIISIITIHSIEFIYTGLILLFIFLLNILIYIINKNKTSKEVISRIFTQGLMATLIMAMYLIIINPWKQVASELNNWQYYFERLKLLGRVKGTLYKHHFSHILGVSGILSYFTALFINWKNFKKNYGLQYIFVILLFIPLLSLNSNIVTSLSKYITHVPLLRLEAILPVSLILGLFLFQVLSFLKKRNFYNKLFIKKPALIICLVIIILAILFYLCSINFLNINENLKKIENWTNTYYWSIWLIWALVIIRVLFIKNNLIKYLRVVWMIFLIYIMTCAMPGSKEIYASVKIESQKITNLSDISNKQIPDRRWKLMDLALINFIKKNIPPYSLFLSNDYHIEDVLPAYTNNEVFLSNLTFSLFIGPDPIPSRRKRLSNFVMDPQQPNIITKYRLLKNSKIDYLILYKNNDGVEKIINYFNQFPLLFEEIYNQNKFVIFQIKQNYRKIDSLGKIHPDMKIQDELAQQVDDLNIEIKQQRNKYIQAMESGVSPEAIINLDRLVLNKTDYANNATILNQSSFRSSPYDAAACLKNNPYYSAANYDNYPNWFIIDLGKEKEISKIQIKWFQKELTGTDWKIEYENKTGSWEKIIEIKNWNESHFTKFFEYYLPKTIKTTKIKFFLTKAYGQNRLLIEKLSFY